MKLQKHCKNKYSFTNLSTKYIVNKINDAQKSNKKIIFKGVGLESTLYYKKYMMENELTKRHISLPLKSQRLYKKEKEYLKVLKRIHNLINTLIENDCFQKKQQYTRRDLKGIQIIPTIKYSLNEKKKSL